MKRFKFRLERVLDYRNMVKKEHERVLAIKNSELRSAEQKLESILHAQDAVDVPNEKEMTMADLSLTGDYLKFLQDSLVQQRVLILEAAQAVEDARQAYIEKAIEAKTLETLKEQKRAEYNEELRRSRQKEMDKISVQRQRFKTGGVKQGDDNG